jgi:hypothetical protein
MPKTTPPFEIREPGAMNGAKYEMSHVRNIPMAKIMLC